VSLSLTIVTPEPVAYKALHGQKPSVKNHYLYPSLPAFVAGTQRFESYNCRANFLRPLQ